ncbi:MAG: hypothetical protein AAGH15_21305 [Myxococcota bacterium]
MRRSSDLRRWLDAPGRTWRWNRGETGGYDAVEASGDVLRWYRWSHEAEDGGEGRLVLQPAAAFLRDGPPRPAPPRVLAELRRHLEANAER